MRMFHNPLKDPLKPLTSIDRFGDPDPQPKRAITGLVSIGVYAFLVGYAIHTGIQYEHEPELQENEVLWSAYGGPYPLTLTCAAERCWASMSLRGAFGPCLDNVPEAQQDTCIEMQHGETVTLSSCYALLPSQGVRLYFVGASAQRWESLAPGLGMGVAPDPELFGFFSVSDMLNYVDTVTVIPTKTPLREGLTLMTYVHTENGTVAEDEAGSDRHEWFSQILDQNPSAEPDNAPCAAQLSASANSEHVHTSVLRMAPDLTKIKVTPNPPFWAALFGEIGGALAACDELLGLTLILFINLMLEVTNRSKAKPDEKADLQVKSAEGDEASTAVVDASVIESRIRQLVSEATVDLTRRLVEAEAAIEQHEHRLREVDGPSNRQSPLSGDGQRPKTARATMAEPATAVEDFQVLDLDSLDQRFKVFDEQTSKLGKAPSSVGSTRESTSLLDVHGKLEGPGATWLPSKSHVAGGSLASDANGNVAAEDSALRGAGDGDRPDAVVPWLSDEVVTPPATLRSEPPAALPPTLESAAELTLPNQMA